MRKITVSCLFCLALSLFPFSAFAAEPDLLDELDSVMESGKKEGAKRKALKPADEKDLPGQIGRHFSAELRLRGYHFFETAPDLLIDTDTHANVGEARLNCSTWMGKDFWSLHAAGWLEAGTQDNTYKGVSPVGRDTDRHRRYAELNEIYFILSSENVDLTSGKKIFKNGISTIYSPANRYRSLDLNDPLDLKDFGLWQAKLDYYAGDTTYTAAVLPAFQPFKVPDIGSPWMAGSFAWDVPDFALKFGKAQPPPFNFNIPPGSLNELIQLLYYFWDLFFNEPQFSNLISNRAVTVKHELPGSSPEDYGWFGRVKTSLGLWDVFVSAYHGPGFYPVIKVEDRGNVVAIIMENPNVFNLAAGFSTTWKDFEFHGEALYNHTDHHKDDNYINYVGGVTYTDRDFARKLHLDRIDLTLEYAGEVITADQDRRGYVVSSRYARIGRDDIFASARIGVNDDITLHYLADIVFWNGSRFHRVGASYRIQPGLVLGLDFEFFDGDRLSYFGRWRNNDRVITTLKWSF